MANIMSSNFDSLFLEVVADVMGRFRISMDFLLDELEFVDSSESISCLAPSIGGPDTVLSRDLFASCCFSGDLAMEGSLMSLFSSVTLAFLPNRIGRQ
jgi:hypothetical protein